MGDNATEIDLDSVIDRLLEGAFLLLGSRNIIYGCRSCRFSISPVYLVIFRPCAHPWADVLTELHDSPFQFSETPRRSVGC
jgi:hypothetical protein